MDNHSMGKFVLSWRRDLVTLVTHAKGGGETDVHLKKDMKIMVLINLFYI